MAYGFRGLSPWSASSTAGTLGQTGVAEQSTHLLAAREQHTGENTSELHPPTRYVPQGPGFVTWA